MTSAQVVETSVTNNSSFQNCSHPDDHTIRTTGNRSFRPKSVSPQVVSPQLKVVSPQHKVVSPQLKVVSPQLKVVSFKVIYNVLTNYLRNKNYDCDEVVSDVLNCSFHSLQSLFPAHAMLMMRRLIDGRSYLQ